MGGGFGGLLDALLAFLVGGGGGNDLGRAALMTIVALASWSSVSSTVSLPSRDMNDPLVRVLLGVSERSGRPRNIASPSDS